MAIRKSSLQARNKKIASRLNEYGIDEAVQNIHVLDETQFHYVPLDKVAERLLILLGIAYTAYNFMETERVMDWLKKERLWKSVSEKEKEFLRTPDPDEEWKQHLSWRFEGAYMLAWTLNKVSLKPDPARECLKDQIDEFAHSIPIVGSSTEKFFSELSYRSLTEIIDESIFYEMVIRYLVDIKVQHKENTSQVQHQASFERHFVLKWVTNFKTETGWDEISSSIKE
jgi:hypothetical protein